LIENVLKDNLIDLDENYNKVLEYSLKIVYRINKLDLNFTDQDLKGILHKVITRFEINANLLSLYIKLSALITDTSNLDDLQNIGKILVKYSYSDQKELVRVATVKSLCKVLYQLSRD